MQQIQWQHAVSTVLRGRPAAAVFLGCISALALSAQTGDSLKFFKNYFITGDYAVGGVNLRGTGVNGYATGGITISDVSPNADILGAFLYWEAVEKGAEPRTGVRSARFNGADLTSIGKQVGSGAPPCWSTGGATGSSNGAHRLVVYRADVLRFIPIDSATGKRLVNTSHSVKVPDSGTGNSLPVAVGASLVVIYRDLSMPLKAISIYDGAFTMDQANVAMNQTVQGVYQASSAGTTGRLTHIVGDGQPNFEERLLYNGGLVEDNPFKAGWDNRTFSVSVPGNAASITTRVERVGGSYDCLSWAAVLFSVPVQDNDNDGLLDTWETNGFTDLGSGAFVNLPAMGANPTVKDIFVEIDYMTGDGHSHLPKRAALDMVANAFKNAPVAGGINIHYDVGGNYQSPPSPHILPLGLAQGGQAIDETTACTANCAFPGIPGVVGWKTGFRYIKDKNFDQSRRNVFRYGLFAHAIGVKRDPDNGIPKSISGVADLPGGDFMVTLGLWDNQVGSDFVQAATLFHEIGHTLNLKHGGDSLLSANCKPIFQSSMNYLYQVSGLLTATGVATIDYSRGALSEVAENALTETSLGTLPYRLRWYVPFPYLDSRLLTTPATKFCDGRPLPPAALPLIRVDGQLVTGAIDWNYDGAIFTAGVPQDINFSGAVDTTSFTGFNDWASIDLRQTASRRNVIKLSLAVGRTDLLNPGDAGLGDAGLGDAGLGDAGLGDAGLGDAGLGDAGLGPASGDAGLGDAGLGDAGLGGDLDFETATALGNAPSGLTAAATKQTIVLNWAAPTVGQVTQYNVYRAVGPISPTNLPVLIGTMTGTPPATTFVDTDVKNNVTYFYTVTALLSDDRRSNASNIVSITK